jgi:hypothetical protein
VTLNVVRPSWSSTWKCSRTRAVRFATLLHGPAEQVARDVDTYREAGSRLQPVIGVENQNLVDEHCQGAVRLGEAHLHLSRPLVVNPNGPPWRGRSTCGDNERCGAAGQAHWRRSGGFLLWPRSGQYVGIAELEWFALWLGFCEGRSSLSAVR